MKILLIHNRYGKYSGEEAVVDAQIELLQKRGHQVNVYFRSSEELEEGILGNTKAFFTAFYNPKSIHDLKKLVNEFNPDLIHIHNLYPLISPAILPEIKKMGIPVVMTVHNYRLMCPNGLFFTGGHICERCTGKGKEWNCITNNCEGSYFKSVGYALRNYWARTNETYLNTVDKYLCLTQFQKNKLVENGFPENKIEVLPNFYNDEIEDIDYDPDARKYVAFSGRISPEKGIHLLLDAAGALPHIPFRLAGGIRNDVLKNIDIPENVKFMGMLNKKDLHEFYSKARFLVLPSIWYEGFPMVFPEAMAYKLPLIAPGMAGYPEIATPDNGRLFKPGDKNSLVKVISGLWDNKPLLIRMAENSYKNLKQKYTGKVYAERLEQCYLNIKNTI